MDQNSVIQLNFIQDIIYNFFIFLNVLHLCILHFKMSILF